MNKLSPELLIETFLDPEIVLNFTPEQWQTVLFVLRSEKLLARFHYLFLEKQILTSLPSAVQRHLDNARVLAEQQRRQVSYEAELLQETLTERGMQFTLLKGAGYTLSRSQAAIGRVYSDIDVLVDKSDIKPVERTLAFMGWFSQPLDDYDERYYRKWAHEIPPISHGVRGTVLDVHHNLVPIVSGKHVDTTAFLQCCRIEKNGIGVLNPAGMFFHSAVHLFFNEDFSSSFRDLTDLYLLHEEHHQILATTLPELTQTFGFKREIGLALYFLVNLFNVELQPALSKLKWEQKEAGRFTLSVLHRALMPSHPCCHVPYKGISDALAEARGHFLKMPLPILLYHLTMKAYRSTVESVLGKHIFTSEAPQNRTTP